MIAAIPNQPINFLPTDTVVDCPDKRIPLIADATDVLRFQFAIDAPSGGGAYEYGNEIRDWELIFDWSGSGPWVNHVQDGICAIGPGAGSYISPFINTFNPTVGVVYQVVIDVTSITGTCTFSIGGQVLTLSTPGSNAFLVIAATTDEPRITLDTSDSRICVTRVRIFEVIGGDSDCVITVEVIDADTQETLFTASSDTRPDLFSIAVSNVSVSIPLYMVDDAEGKCIYLRATSTCDEGGEALCSQPIKIGDCKGTITLRGCLDYDAMGFDAPAIFQARVRASLVRPRFEYDTSEERWSDGTINRYYIDRQRTMELLIQPVDEALHPFLAALAMFDHVYIGNDEYSIDADSYDPSYGDNTSTAAVSLTVRKKRELMRRTTCDAPGEGCSPLNDPPCRAPNIDVSYEWDGAGAGYIIHVTLYQALGFLPGTLRIYINGVHMASENWIGPMSYNFGPYAAESVVRIEVTNEEEPECNWINEFTLPAAPFCEGVGFGYFTVQQTGTVRVRITGSTGSGNYGTLKGPGETDVVTFSGTNYHTFGRSEPLLQTYCFWQSDVDGVPGNILSDFSFDTPGYGILTIDVTQITTITIFAAQNNLLTYIDLSTNTGLTTIDLSGNDLASIDLPPPGASLLFLDLRDNNLTSLNLAGYTSPYMFIDLTNNAITNTDQILIDIEANNPANHGYLAIDGGTNAAPTATGLAAKALLVGRGWTVVNN